MPSHFYSNFWPVVVRERIYSVLGFLEQAEIVYKIYLHDKARRM